MMKKIVVFLVVLTFLVVSVSAATPREDAERAIQNYFHQRQLLLTNQADTIPIALSGITQDELKHRSHLAESSITFIESQITITVHFVEELYGSATVIETVNYRKDGAVFTEQISHEVNFHRRNESITIGSDGYFDSVSAFSSISYVPNEAPEVTTVTTMATSVATSTTPVATQPEPPPTHLWLFLTVGVLICAAIGGILIVIFKKKK